jgi:hypothetical protein
MGLLTEANSHLKRANPSDAFINGCMDEIKRWISL